MKASLVATGTGLEVGVGQRLNLKSSGEISQLKTGFSPQQRTSAHCRQDAHALELMMLGKATQVSVPEMLQKHPLPSI